MFNNNDFDDNFLCNPDTFKSDVFSGFESALGRDIKEAIISLHSWSHKTGAIARYKISNTKNDQILIIEASPNHLFFEDFTSDNKWIIEDDVYYFIDHYEKSYEVTIFGTGTYTDTFFKPRRDLIKSPL